MADGSENLDANGNVIVYPGGDASKRPTYVPPDKLWMAQRDGFFPAKVGPAPPPKTGAGKAFLEGARQGASFGFADELSGLQHAVMTKVLGPAEGVDPSFEESFADAYRTGRDSDRGGAKKAQADRPGWYLGGALTGGLATAPLIPGAAAATLPRAVGTGLGLGAVQGAGAAEKVEDLPGSMVGGALLGAGFGAAGNVAGRAIGAAARGASAKLAEVIAPKVKAAADQADELRVLTASGATGGSIARPPVLREALRVPGGVKETARVMRETGMAPVIGTTGSVERSARAAGDEANDAIRAIIEGVDDAGVKVDIKAFAQRMREEAWEMMRRSPELDDAARTILLKAKTYETRYPQGVTMSKAQELVTELGKQPNWTRAATGAPIPNAQEAAKTATRALREQMDEAAQAAFRGQDLPAAVNAAQRVFPKGQIPDDALAAYQRARRVSQVARIIGDAAEESTQRAGKNQSIPWQLVGRAAQVGTAGKAPGLAALLVAAKQGGKTLGASARATAAETGVKVLERLQRRALSGSLADAARRLSEASTRGPQEVAVEHLTLMMTDPGYRAFAEQADAEEARPQTPTRSLRSLAP